jgi:hypothetical protein
VLKNGFLAHTYVLLPILIDAPAVGHEPPEVAAVAGVAKPRIKKLAITAADNFLFMKCSFY